MLAWQHTRACLFCALTLGWSAPACGVGDRVVSESAEPTSAPPALASGGGSAPAIEVTAGEGESPGEGESLGEAGAPASGLPPGLSNVPVSVACGASKCSASKVGPVFIDPCCDSTERCGLTTSFLAQVGAQFEEVCQAHHQPGIASDACPVATGLALPLSMGAQTLMVPLDPFSGCCRPDGSCGVVIEKLSTGGGKLPIASLDLGCVEAAPFMQGRVNTCGNEGAQSSGGARDGSGGGPALGAGGAG